MIPAWRSLAVVVALVALTLTGCEREASTATDQPAAQSVDDPVADPVVVYATDAERAYLSGLFAEFTRATGIQVVSRTGPAGQLVDDVIENRIDPPADLLWTKDVTHLFTAAEEGALRPIRSATLDADIPASLRDPDGFWTAISFRLAAIVYDAASVDSAAVSGYGSLAGERFAKRLCLGSVSSAVNRAVIAVLIGELGDRRAESAVRAWIRGLGREVYADDARLLAAIAAGDCAIGIVSTDTLALARRAGVADDVQVVLPAAVAASAEGIGIARHARNPEGALELLEWLLDPGNQAQHAAAQFAYPANREAPLPDGLEAPHGVTLPSLSGLAFRSPDAELLAERTGYRD